MIRVIYVYYHLNHSLTLSGLRKANGNWQVDQSGFQLFLEFLEQTFADAPPSEGPSVPATTTHRGGCILGQTRVEARSNVQISICAFAEYPSDIQGEPTPTLGHRDHEVSERILPQERHQPQFMQHSVSLCVCINYQYMVLLNDIVEMFLSLVFVLYDLMLHVIYY